MKGFKQTTKIKRSETFGFSAFTISDLETGLEAAKKLVGDARVVHVHVDHARDGFDHEVEITVAKADEEFSRD